MHRLSMQATSSRIFFRGDEHQPSGKAPARRATPQSEADSYAQTIWPSSNGVVRSTCDGTTRTVNPYRPAVSHPNEPT
jgi:hypothetical protein